jgi:hypothetical protein
MLKEPLHDEMRCPLCGGCGCELFFEDAKRRYLRCCSCGLVFVPARYWLDLEAERAEYDLHENAEDDPGYRKFLTRLAAPLLERLPPHQHGLDFGCGPDSALPAMLEEHGHRVELYDPFYADNPSALNTTYDFICATEVVEHLRHPRKEFTTLFSLLKPSGWLGVMTKMVRDRESFANWHYIRDPTHISFYHKSTFDYLARHFNAEACFIGSDVVLFQTH